MDLATTLSVAGWLIPVALDKLADRALQAWVSRVKLGDELDKLSFILKRMQRLLRRARKLKVAEDDVSDLNQLERLARRAENLVDELDYHRLQHQVESPETRSTAVDSKVSHPPFLLSSFNSLIITGRGRDFVLLELLKFVLFYILQNIG